MNIFYCNTYLPFDDIIKLSFDVLHALSEDNSFVKLTNLDFLKFAC